MNSVHRDKMCTLEEEIELLEAQCMDCMDEVMMDTFGKNLKQKKRQRKTQPL